MKDRTGFEVEWRERAIDDDRYAPRIRQLLADGLTADSAVRIALLNNRDLQAEFEGVGVGVAEIASATVLDNPEVEGELRIPLDGDGKGIQVSVLQDVMSLVTLPRRRNAARAELGAARASAAAAAVDLVAEVRQAFYDAQAANQIVGLHRTVLDSLSAGYELAQRLHDAGNITDLALAQERALLGEGKLDLSNAELALEQTREQLNALLGLTGADTAWTLASELPIPSESIVDTDQIERMAIEANLQLDRERWRMRAAAERIGIARIRAWLPKIGAGASAEREFDGAWSVGPAVSLSIPLFDRKQGDRARGHAELRSAQHRYAAIAVTVRARARAARMAVRTARARFVFVRDELLPTRTAVLEQTLLQYNAMNATPFELLSAKREQIGAAVAYIDSLHAYWRALATIEQLRMGSAPQSSTSMREAQ